MQESGYKTALLENALGEAASSGRKLDDPQPGFDHWVSFAGQGNYYPTKPDGSSHMLNVNGESVPQRVISQTNSLTTHWLGLMIIKTRAINHSSYTCLIKPFTRILRLPNDIEISMQIKQSQYQIAKLTLRKP